MTSQPVRVVAALLVASVPVARLAAQSGTAPLTTFAYDRAAPLELTDSLLRIEGGIAVHAISFASPKGGRATGLLFVPSGSGPFAGVVVQHGAPGRIDSTLVELLHRSIMPTALAVARAGAVAIALDAPWARRLVPPVTFTEADSAFQVQLIVDLQRAVDVLVARPDVDSARLGYVGRSYGGAQGALFAGVERRLKAFVLQVGDGGLVSHFQGPDGRGDPPPGVPADRWRRWLAAMSPIEPIRFVGRAAPAKLLLQSGRTDPVVPPELARQLHEAASDPKTVMWYDAGHGLNSEAADDMVAFLRRQIGLSPP
ncbi:MAG: prolyl oligopeptidase family serine peptidase [Gemmatimonadetes bacterium]|nr:prolyl oligopeptidase family serine peptidase [Gemmatimonadota bacterium]